jgi:hypothetical protein
MLLAYWTGRRCLSSFGPASVIRPYTRKSTEEGLDEEFNSLDAQRESAEALVRNSVATGW